MRKLESLKKRQVQLEREYDRVLLSREVLAFFKGRPPRWGSDTVETTNYSLREVGEFFGVSSSRMAQIEALALKKLSHPIFCRRIEHLRYRHVQGYDPIVNSAIYSVRHDMVHVTPSGRMVWGSPRYDLYRVYH